jgi:hypothetical protein
MVTRAMLGLEPNVPEGVLSLNPCLPDGTTVTLTGLALGDHVASFTVTGVEVVDAVTPTLGLVMGARAVGLTGHA